MNAVRAIAAAAAQSWREVCLLAAVIWSVAVAAFTPGMWRRTARSALAAQISSTGVGAIGITALVAAMVGLSVVVQAQLWLTRIGQSHMLGTFLVAVVLREAAPLLVNLIIIGRTGSFIVAELGAMAARGEVRALDAQGVDPFRYLVVPRVLGLTLSALCLAVTFVVCSLAGGCALGMIVSAGADRPAAFAVSVLRAVGLADVLSAAAKTAIPAMMTGSICCMMGVRVAGPLSDVPSAVRRALVRSVGAVFVVSALASALTYY